MNKGKSAIKRIAAREVSDRVFKAIENHPIVKDTESEMFIDLFNSGIIINVTKTVRKHYPMISEVLKDIVAKEIKKL